MSRQRMCIALGLCVSVVACQTPPDEDEELEDPELVTQAGIAEPKSAPFGSLGGVCGVDWVKCRTSAQMTSVFGKLKKKVGKITHTLPTRPTESDTVKYNITVPRLVNDHKGKNDVLAITQVMGASGDGTGSRARYSLKIARNGVDVVAYAATVDLDGNIVGDRQTADITRGGAEAFAVFGIDPKMIRTLMDSRKAGLSRAPGGNSICDITQNECIGCHSAKAAAVAWGGFIGGAIGLVGTPAGSAIGAAIGVAVGTAVAAQYDCGPLCGRGKCNKHYCECVRLRNEPIGGSPSCSNDLDRCCFSNTASWCDKNSNGCYRCR